MPPVHHCTRMSCVTSSDSLTLSQPCLFRKRASCLSNECHPCQPTAHHSCCKVFRCLDTKRTRPNLHRIFAASLDRPHLCRVFCGIFREEYAASLRKTLVDHSHSMSMLTSLLRLWRLFFLLGTQGSHASQNFAALGQLPRKRVRRRSPRCSGTVEQSIKPKDRGKHESRHRRRLVGGAVEDTCSRSRKSIQRSRIAGSTTKRFRGGEQAQLRQLPVGTVSQKGTRRDRSSLRYHITREPVPIHGQEAMRPEGSAACTGHVRTPGNERPREDKVQDEARTVGARTHHPVGICPRSLAVKQCCLRRPPPPDNRNHCKTTRSSRSQHMNVCSACTCVAGLTFSCVTVESQLNRQRMKFLCKSELHTPTRNCRRGSANNRHTDRNQRARRVSGRRHIARRKEQRLQMA